MRMKNTKLATALVSIFTLIASMFGLISVGFASWTISKNERISTQGEVAADSVIYFDGINITSVSSFTYGRYSFGNDSTFISEGKISYTLSVTPYNLDNLSKISLRSSNGLKIYARFDSLFQVFNKSNDAFTIFNGVSSTSSPALTNFSNCVASSDYKKIDFNFVIPQMSNSQLDDSGPEVSFSYNLIFTFNNRLLSKNYGVDENSNPLTIMDNKFTLYLGKEAF